MPQSQRPRRRRHLLRSHVVILLALAALLGALSVSSNALGGPTVPLCNQGVITNNAAPSLTAANPIYLGGVITSSPGSWVSCGESITSYYKEWLRNGAVISGPTLVQGGLGNFTYAVTQADIGNGIRSGIKPCNADGCYASFVLSANTITPANRAPASPSALAPATGTTADSLTPRFSSVFSDPDGQTGYVSYIVKRASDNVVVASGNGPSVASGSASAWTAPSGLAAGKFYNWYAQAHDVKGAVSATVGPVSYFANPVWVYPACSDDGNPAANTAACNSTGTPDQSAATAETCVGADAVCDGTLEDVQAAGYETSGLQEAFNIEDAGNPDFAGSSPSSPCCGGYTGNWSLMIFNLVQAGGCASNPIVDSGHCGMLWFEWASYVNGVHGPMHYTGFYARSGDNNPLHKWVQDTGPLPDHWASSSFPANEDYHHAGWNYGHYQGFIPNSTDPYYPGIFTLDPFNVFSGANGGGTQRNAFYIHGGRNGHGYDQSRTLGCIRIRVPALQALKGKWYGRADNRAMWPGPTVYVYESA